MIPSSDRPKAPIANHRFVTTGNIARMISRAFKNITYSKDDIIEWCWEVTEAIGSYNSFHEFLNYEIAVTDNKAILPCGVYRLLRINDGSGCRINDYTDYGNYIEVKGATRLKIDYLGIPVDEEGLPAIDVEAKKACFYYCLQMLLMEDYFNGRVPENRWQDIDRKYWGWVAFARGSFRNRKMDDVDRVQQTIYQFVRGPRMNRRLIHGGNT